MDETGMSHRMGFVVVIPTLYTLRGEATVLQRERDFTIKVLHTHKLST